MFPAIMHVLHSEKHKMQKIKNRITNTEKLVKKLEILKYVMAQSKKMKNDIP